MSRDGRAIIFEQGGAVLQAGQRGIFDGGVGQRGGLHAAHHHGPAYRARHRVQAGHQGQLVGHGGHHVLPEPLLWGHSRPNGGVGLGREPAGVAGVARPRQRIELIAAGSIAATGAQGQLLAGGAGGGIWHAQGAQGALAVGHGPPEGGGQLGLVGRLGLGGGGRAGAGRPAG